jgi:hypothetical protein
MLINKITFVDLNTNNFGYTIFSSHFNIGQAQYLNGENLFSCQMVTGEPFENR